MRPTEARSFIPATATPRRYLRTPPPTLYKAPAEYPGQTNHTGQTNHAGSSEYSGGNGTNATTSFTVLDDCTLKSVRVYTDLAGERLIQVKNGGGTVVASATVNVPVTTALPGSSTRIDLNFSLAPRNLYDRYRRRHQQHELRLRQSPPQADQRNGRGVSVHHYGHLVHYGQQRRQYAVLLLLRLGSGERQLLLRGRTHRGNGDRNPTMPASPKATRQA